LTAEAGYSINDETFYNLSKADQSATGNHDHSIVCDGININVRFGSAANVYGVANKASGAQSLLEPFREVSIHGEAAVNRRSMRRIMARRMKATAFRA
jgi:hypothetical protein